jgi:hypothetical protein
MSGQKRNSIESHGRTDCENGMTGSTVTLSSRRRGTATRIHAETAAQPACARQAKEGHADCKAAPASSVIGCSKGTKMNAMRGVFVGSIAMILLACGGTTSSGGSGLGSLASCTISAGTYTINYTVVGSSSCPPIAGSTTTLAESGSLADLGSTIMADGTNCSAQGNGSTCTESIDCSISEDAVTAQISVTLTLDGDSASGQATETITESGETITCAYDISLTKS